MTSVHDSVHLILHFLSRQKPGVSFQILLYIFHMHKYFPFLSHPLHSTHLQDMCCFTYLLYPVRTACLRISLLIGMERLLWCRRLIIHNYWASISFSHQLVCDLHFRLGRSLSLTHHTLPNKQTNKKQDRCFPDADLKINTSGIGNSFIVYDQFHSLLDGFLAQKPISSYGLRYAVRIMQIPSTYLRSVYFLQQ
jgi:hypothetical protein